MTKGIQDGVGDLGKGLMGGAEGDKEKEGGPTPEQLQKSAKNEDKFTIDLMNAKNEGYVISKFLLMTILFFIHKKLKKIYKIHK